MVPLYILMLFVVWAQGRHLDVKSLNSSDAAEGIEKFIVGGEYAPNGAFPWQVSLVNIQGNNYHFCGGSIIGKKWILSASHCFVNRTPKSFAVLAGTNKLSSGAQGYLVKEIIRHESFDSSTLNNDIALVKLAGELEFSDKVKAVELEESYVEGGEKATVSGWGYVDNSKTGTDDLKMLEVKTMSVNGCKDELQNIQGLKYNENEICAYTRGREGVCQGDSGGPLVKNDKQIGVVSWVVPCARGYPDVYTRVSPYLDWIKKKTKN